MKEMRPVHIDESREGMRNVVAKQVFVSDPLPRWRAALPLYQGESGLLSPLERGTAAPLVARQGVAHTSC